MNDPSLSPEPASEDEVLEADARVQELWPWPGFSRWPYDALPTGWTRIPQGDQ